MINTQNTRKSKTLKTKNEDRKNHEMKKNMTEIIQKLENIMMMIKTTRKTVMVKVVAKITNHQILAGFDPI